jgi:hypothetical protein
MKTTRNNSIHSTTFTKGNSSELKRVNDVGHIEIINCKYNGMAGSQAMISNMLKAQTDAFSAIPNLRNGGDFNESPIK